MSASNTFRDLFSNDISVFIDTLINHSAFTSFVWGLFTVLIIIVYFTEVAKFMFTGFDIESTTQSTLMVFATLLIFASYQTIFDTTHQLFDEIGLTIQETGTGYRDPFFLFKWVTYSFNSMYNEDVSFWRMPFDDMVYAVLWYIIATLLQVVMFAIGSWAVWVLALTKILGVLFIPLLIHPSTRNLFDGWFRFTLGSLFLLIVLKATGTLAALAIKAQFASIGLISCGSAVNFSSCTVAGKAINMSMSGLNNVDLLVTGILSIFLVVSSIGLTSALVGNVSSPSRAATSGASKLAKLGLNKFLPKK
jgi:type IV secretory pathway VirB6-like protein